MKLKDKIKSYSFWVSLASAVILILKILGTRFGFSVDETMVSDLFTALCSILVLLGIIVVPSNIQTSQKNKPENEPVFNKKETHNDETILEQTQTVEIKNDSEISVLEENKTNTDTTESSFVETIVQETNIQQQAQDSTKEIEDNIENEIAIQSNQEQSQSFETPIIQNNENTSFVSDLKTFLELERKKYTGNLDAYIFELQEEIRKTREGM